jgi:hypothetical protein
MSEEGRLRQEEIDEFNEGFQAYGKGVRFEDLPEGKHDQLGIGYAWAAFGDLRNERKAAVDLLKGMVGLIQLAIARDNKLALLKANHRYVDAVQFLATQETK